MLRDEQNGPNSDDLPVRQEECSLLLRRLKWDSTKVGGMNYVRGILPEPPTDKLENHDLLREATCARSSSAKRQRDADIPPRSSSRLHGQKMEIEAGVRLAEAKKMRESSAWAKSSSSASAVDPKANKSSPVGDACVFDLLKMNFV
ncbi:unnamed protein product [Prunus armeniaca]